MVFVRQILDGSPQFFHFPPLLAVVLLLLALHDLDAVRQFQERVGDVLGGRVHPGAGVVSQGAASMAFWAVAAGGGQLFDARAHCLVDVKFRGSAQAPQRATRSGGVR